MTILVYICLAKMVVKVKFCMKAVGISDVPCETTFARFPFVPSMVLSRDGCKVKTTKCHHCFSINASRQLKKIARMQCQCQNNFCRTRVSRDIARTEFKVASVSRSESTNPVSTLPLSVVGQTIKAKLPRSGYKPFRFLSERQKILWFRERRQKWYKYREVTYQITMYLSFQE